MEESGGPGHKQWRQARTPSETSRRIAVGNGPCAVIPCLDQCLVVCAFFSVFEKAAEFGVTDF
jgi:hypothetical protein